MRVELTTRFSPGDKVWCIVGGYTAAELTVGLVRVEVIDSSGHEGEEMFDNYKPQIARKEEYMMVEFESGIGSGNVYTLGVHVFATKEECQSAIARWRQQAA